MIQIIKRWFSKQPSIAERLATLETTLSTLADEKAQIENDLTAAKQQLNVYRVQEEADKDRYSSVEPWVVIKSDTVDPIKGLRMELDWNDAFIQYLRDNGMSGKSDDEIVQKWIAFLYSNLIEKLEEQVIDENSKPRVSDYT